jgi:nucleoside-specific outer membrane channel protein Tsx
MKLNRIFATCALASAASLSQAAPIWQDFSISALYGENYAFPFAGDKNDQSTITFEYTAKLKYGDFFAFADRTNNDDGNATYFEVSPRLSLGAVTGQKLEFGPIKDVLIATTWEGNSANYTGSDFNNYLFGIGFDIAIPKFQYAQVNLYRAINDIGSHDYQFTFVYGIPFKLGNEEFLADAFLDWTTSEDDKASEFNWTSQYKWNAGKHISPETKLYVGVEHSIWRNKFGFKDTNEHNVSALVKYHF